MELTNARQSKKLDLYNCEGSSECKASLAIDGNNMKILYLLILYLEINKIFYHLLLFKPVWQCQSFWVYRLNPRSIPFSAGKKKRFVYSQNGYIMFLLQEYVKLFQLEWELRVRAPRSIASDMTRRRKKKKFKTKCSLLFNS